MASRLLVSWIIETIINIITSNDLTAPHIHQHQKQDEELNIWTHRPALNEFSSTRLIH
ncbi:hypothetical protein V6x_41830 [Gimesia chilikensis]|uniref:Uncharacterized protein n=1 Tax=Gimesia chilikensis TaxID=2605989 RepID=A0A517WGS7_9PLAN|nr:hypothetical protein V6x_41830 [Gimesia chilikensis]